MQNPALNIWFRFWAAFIALMLAAMVLLAATTCRSVVSLGDTKPWPTCVIRFVPDLTYRGEIVSGLTEYEAAHGRFSHVSINSSASPERRHCVIVHELLHVAGLWAHGGDTYFDSNGTRDMSLALDRATTARLVACMTCDIFIQCPPERFREVVAAANFLNATLKRNGVVCDFIVSQPPE